MIDKIVGVTPLTNVQNTRKLDGAGSIDSGVDTISISAEAKRRSEDIFLSKIASETPDIREDLVARMKAKINDPSFASPQAIARAADKLMEAFGV